jgi:hypothetical protein
MAGVNAWPARTCAHKTERWNWLGRPDSPLVLTGRMDQDLYAHIKRKWAEGVIESTNTRVIAVIGGAVRASHVPCLQSVTYSHSSFVSASLWR